MNERTPESIVRDEWKIHFHTPAVDSSTESEVQPNGDVYLFATCVCGKRFAYMGFNSRVAARFGLPAPPKEEA